MVEVYADVFEDWRTARNGVISGKKPEWIPGVTTVPVAEPKYPKNPPLRQVASSVFRARRVTHCALVVKDLQGMTEWYTRYLGLQVFASGADYALLSGTASQCVISLYRAKDLPLGLHHVGMEVGSEADLSRALDLLPGAGVKLDSQIEHPARRAVTVFDPDGIRLQFFVDRDWQAKTLSGLTLDQALALL
jgi:catechol 2,3-dioxygenase